MIKGFEYESILNKYYTIEVAIPSQTGMDITSHHFLKQGMYQVYKNVKLVNVNGMGTGQAHFITEDGSYILLPWCYIIAMFPKKNEIPKQDTDPCRDCARYQWDLPQCKECNAENNFKHFERW